MTDRYRLRTTKISPEEYRHELLRSSDNAPLDIGDLSARQRGLVEMIGRNSARCLEASDDTELTSAPFYIENIDIFVNRK